MDEQKRAAAFDWFKENVASDVDAARLFGDGANPDVVEARKHCQTIIQLLSPAPQHDDAELQEAVEKAEYMLQCGLYPKHEAVIKTLIRAAASRKRGEADRKGGE